MKRPKLAVVREFVRSWEYSILQYCRLFDVEIVTQPQYVSKKGYPIKVSNLLPKFLGYKTIASSFIVFMGLEQALKDADIVNLSNLYSLISRQCAKISNKRGAKLAVSVWQTIPHHLLYSFAPPYGFNTRFVMKHTDMYLALTKRAIVYLQSLSAPRERIRLIYPGVDLQRFTPAKRQDHESIRILFVGRLVPCKGILLLLEAFSHLYKVLPNVELWIIGRGELSPYVMMFAKKYPVKYLGGWLTSNALIQAYQQCDVFCLPTYDHKVAGFKTYEEQFGLVLAEAMACGLPIVATNCGAIPEVVGHKNLVVQQKSVRDLFLALHKMIQDDDYRRYLRKANRTRAEKLFDSRKQAEKLEKCLSELL